MIHSAREALIWFNKIYHGDWDRIYKAIQSKEQIPDEIEDDHADDKCPTIIRIGWIAWTNDEHA